MSKWRGVLLGGGAALAIAGASLWFGAAPGASGAGEATLAMDPGTSNVSLDSASFELAAKVSNVNNLGGYELTIAFDNDALEFLGLTVTNFLRSTGRQTQCETTGTSVANQYGALRHSCSTFGIIENGVGTEGPDGLGTIAVLRFRPKAVGTTYLTFEAAGPPDLNATPEAASDDPNEHALTSLFEVEVCDRGQTPQCADYGVDLTTVDAVLSIFDPNGPTPTGVPATPTPRPTSPARDPRDIQATAQAVLTPSARLTPRAGTVAASGGTGGQGSGGSPSGAVGPGAIGPDGAPIAGYGPQEQESNEWPARAGMALAVIGAVAIAAGVTARTRSARDAQRSRE